MALTTDEKALVEELQALLLSQRTRTDTLDDYFNGTQTLKQLGLAVPATLQRFAVVLRWAPLPVMATEARLEVTNFQTANPEAQAAIREIWHANHLDEMQSYAHTEAMALGSSYVCIGANAQNPKRPIVSIESPREMVVKRDPRDRSVMAALRLYDNDERATLYLPNVTRWLVKTTSGWRDEFEPNQHNLGIVPVVPFINGDRPTRRPGKPVGVSDMDAIIPIADAASRALTNLQIAQETMAVPQRAVLGASKEDFMDKDGNVLPAWQTYFSSVWAHGNKDVKVEQFDAAPMKNFDDLYTTYAKAASSVTPLEVEAFGLVTDSPPSAESRRAAEADLIKHTERKQTLFGHAWERVMEIALLLSGTAVNGRIEAQWRDAGTPTKAQTTDAVVKQFQVHLTDWETAQEDLGRSPDQIEQMKARRLNDEALRSGVTIANGVEAYIRSEAEDGDEAERI